MDVLRDAVWQFVGAFLALLAILVTWIVYRKQKTTKVMAYQILEPVSLVKIHKEFGDELKIIFRDFEAKSAYIGFINIVNKGNTLITRKDFDANLSVSFTDKGQLISFSIVDKFPKNLPINIISNSENSITLDAFLLNAKENFTLSGIVINDNISIVPSVRIIGGELKSIETLENSFLFKSLSRIDLSFLLGLVISLLILIVTSAFYSFVRSRI